MVAILDSVPTAVQEITLAAAIGMGMLSSVNVCAAVRLPILAAFVTGVGGSRRHGLILTGLFVLGFVGGIILLGLTAASPADGIPRSLQVSKYSFWVLGFGMIVAGVLRSGLINPRLLPERWRGVSGRLVRTDLPGAVLLGLVLGLLQTPACPACRVHLQAAVGAAPAGFLWSGLVLPAGFAAGQSLVLLIAGALTTMLRPELVAWLRKRMCSLEPRLQLLTGNMLVVLGINFLIVG
ncbi:MAG: hypothetical protein MUC88_14760 [Planctomycetes bacterium]|jgi:cytochrome c biogenesis protein CcdA|nr:hypothetical protein [Planctomycetota bacterium]